MASPDTHLTEHEITVAAPAAVVFDLIADVGNWPTIFPPTLHAEQIERTGNTERIRIWATANGAVKNWCSRRDLDQDRLRIRFRQEVSQAPVASMGGEWIIEPRSDSETRVRLTHEFQAVGNEPENVDWIQRAVDHNSGAELAALQTAAQHKAALSDLVLSFYDVVQVAGDPKDVYDFLNLADRWPQRLPHVSRVALDEPVAGVQTLEMDTKTADGSVHTTRSIRICFAPDRIVYKQLQTPALLTVHTGRWDITTESGGATVTATHNVVINPAAVPTVLGTGATVADARTAIREALGRNSTTTMRHAKAYAEQRVSV